MPLAARARGSRRPSSGATSEKCWVTIPIPAAIASRGERIATGLPSMRISPASAAVSPYRMRISVVLPAPFSPSRAWTSPRPTSRSTLVVGDEVPEPLGDPRAELDDRRPRAPGSDRSAVEPAPATVATRAARLVDVDPERPGLDRLLFLLDLRQEVRWHAAGDGRVDLGEGGPTLGDHAEVLEVLGGV